MKIKYSFHTTFESSSSYLSYKRVHFWGFGDIGVDLFFVISGFIMFYIIEKPSLNAINNIRRTILLKN